MQHTVSMHVGAMQLLQYIFLHWWDRAWQRFGLSRCDSSMQSDSCCSHSINRPLCLAPTSAYQDSILFRVRVLFFFLTLDLHLRLHPPSPAAVPSSLPPTYKNTRYLFPSTITTIPSYPIPPPPHISIHNPIPIPTHPSPTPFPKSSISIGISI